MSESTEVDLNGVADLVATQSLKRPAANILYRCSLTVQRLFALHLHSLPPDFLSPPRQSSSKHQRAASLLPVFVQVSIAPHLAKTAPNIMAQVAPSAQPTKHTSLDYSLPPATADSLLQPCDKMHDALLGPLDPSFASVPAKDEPKVPFLAAMATTGDTFTAKGAVAHKSTDSPIVDLFYEYTPGVTSERLFELLGAAWKKDAKR